MLTAIGVIVYGYVHTQVTPWNQRIVAVNGEVFNMRDYVQVLRACKVKPEETHIDTARSYIDMMVEYELMRQAAQRYGIYPEVADEVEEQIKHSKQFFEDADLDFEEWLKELKISEADLKRWWWEFEPQVLIDKLRDFITGDLKGYPPPPELEAELKDYYVPIRTKQVELLGILVGTEDEAIELIHILKKNIGTFFQLAREYSHHGPSKQEIHLQGIRVDSLEKAEDVMTRLEDGVDFASLVAEYSLDEESEWWLTYAGLKSKFGESNCDNILKIDPDSDNPYAIAIVDKENYWVIKALERKLAGYMGWMPQEYIEITYSKELAEAAFELAEGKPSMPIRFTNWRTDGGYWIVQAVESSKTEDGEENIHLRVILLDSKGEAKNLIDEISRGADFAELAQENSLHQASKENGGDLGWLTRGELQTTFHLEEGSQIIEDILNLGEDELRRQPIQDDKVIKSSGYWIIVTNCKAYHQVSTECRSKLKDEAFERWQEEERKNYEAEIITYVEGENGEAKIREALDRV
jgi:parvulin-like peptidyl-prolyl isomerase